jgi:AraC family ethanolamine operon transcriptional activator
LHNAGLQELQDCIVITSPTQAPFIVHRFAQDIDDYRHSLKVLAPTIRQMSKGWFQGGSTRIHLLDFTLIRRMATASYSSTCWVPHEATFLFPLDDRDALVRGRLLGQQHQIGSLGDHEANIIFPANYRHLFVTLPLHALPRYLDTDECSLFLDALSVIETGLVDAQAKRATTARLAGIVQQIETCALPPLPSTQEEYCVEIVDILFNYLANYLACHARHAPTRAGNREKILQRSLHLFETRPLHCFSLDELAREVYASKRAVQYAFSSILGLSPMRFQKLHRLNLIRDELKSVASPAKFASLIAKYAFSNPGRLVREYCDFFGERPKDTQRRKPSGPPDQRS